VLGLFAPTLLMGILILIEHFGLHLGVGGGLIGLISFVVCLVSISMQSTTALKKLILILFALMVIPLEIFALGFVFIMINGLTGTQ